MVKGNIRPSQITHAAVVIIFTTSLMTKQLYVYTKNDAWLVAIAALGVSFVIYLMYIALTRRFQGLNLFEINGTVFGKPTGKVISGLYLYFFFTIACFNVNIIGNFINAFVLPNTPVFFTLLVFVSICIWSARKGTSNLLKSSVLFSVLSILIILVNALLLIKVYHAENFLPILTLPVKNYLAGIHSLSVLPLCEPIVLLMFIPELESNEGFGKALLKGLVIGSCVLFIVILRDIAVLGPSSEILSYPSYTTIRFIDIGDILTRVDIIYVSILISLMFYKVSLFFSATVSGMQQLFGFDSYQFMVFMIGVLLLLYGLTIFPSAHALEKWLIDGSATIHHSIFILLLPMLTLVVAVVRGFFRKPETAPH